MVRMSPLTPFLGEVTKNDVDSFYTMSSRKKEKKEIISTNLGISNCHCTHLETFVDYS